jgi:hypothetical protein
LGDGSERRVHRHAATGPDDDRLLRAGHLAGSAEGALLAYAATLSENLDGMAGFMGVVQQSEPQWF